MRLASVQRQGEPRVAAVVEGGLVDLAAAYRSLLRAEDRHAAGVLAAGLLPGEMTQFLAVGEPALDAARRALDHAAGLSDEVARREGIAIRSGEANLLPAVPLPPKVICVARNYAEHAKEAGFELPELPILFARFPSTLVASGEPVVRPTVSHQLDWEGELAVVIGRPGRHITRDRAMDHVVGYAIFNDVTVRDYQFRVPQYTSGKNFAASGPFGPYLTLAEEIEDPHDLELVTEISGEEMQRATTRDMFFDIPTLIEHISEFIALEPGDVIATGTPAGVGFKREPPRFLKPGDEVRVSITGLGVLTNPVIAEEDMS
jgi:2-keto-4-pentenoate hydratase/2-oxohepta-3-ene-1,7-dioic acid hydratase in catechol pathway